MDRLSAHPSLAIVPIIVVSARDPERNRRRALEKGVVEYQQKPIDNEALIRAIRTALDSGQPAASALRAV